MICIRNSMGFGFGYAVTPWIVAWRAEYVYRHRVHRHVLLGFVVLVHCDWQEDPQDNRQKLLAYGREARPQVALSRTRPELWIARGTSRQFQGMFETRCHV